MVRELWGRAARRTVHFSFRLALGATIIAGVAGCGEGFPPPPVGQHITDGAGQPPATTGGAPVTGGTAPVSTKGLRIELSGTPVAVFNPATGKTTVAIDYLVRNADGVSVDPAKTTARRLVNGKEADVESVPDFRDTKLSSNLKLGLVLDASYSMTVSKPPAFEPMKKAANDTQLQIRQQFAAWNSGSFTTLLGWFQDQYVCAPSAPTMPDAAVLDIPAPVPGDSTKLLAATAQMVDRMKAQYDATPNPTASDHYALVLFTDGWDNYSWFDNASAPAKSYPATGGSFTCGGTAPVALEGLISRIKAFPQLKVHVIGLGSDLKASELSAIATAGQGRFASNPDTGQVSSLFAEITREFTTIRRDGITMPLPPGEYEYVQEVTANGATTRVKFRFSAGDATAAVKAGSVVVE